MNILACYILDFRRPPQKKTTSSEMIITISSQKRFNTYSGIIIKNTHGTENQGVGKEWGKDVEDVNNVGVHAAVI